MLSSESLWDLLQLLNSQHLSSFFLSSNLRLIMFESIFISAGCLQTNKKCFTYKINFHKHKLRSKNLIPFSPFTSGMSRILCFRASFNRRLRRRNFRLVVPMICSTLIKFMFMFLFCLSLTHPWSAVSM